MYDNIVSDWHYCFRFSIFLRVEEGGTKCIAVRPDNGRKIWWRKKIEKIINITYIVIIMVFALANARAGDHTNNNSDNNDLPY